MELINLHDFIEKIIADFDSSYFSQDRKLPDAFKEYVKSNAGGEKFTFYDYTTVVYTGLSIYCPNQWFYIAAYYCKLYPVLQQYKDAVYANAKLPDSPRNYQSFFAELSGNIEESKDLFVGSGLSSEKIELLAKFLADYPWWRGGKGIERNDFYYSPILSAAALVNQSQSYVAEICKYLVNNPSALEILQTAIQGKSVESNNSSLEFSRVPSNHQIIFYGAPGTGKSHKVEEDYVKGHKNFRITFHPDTDYASFVGCYKPSMGGDNEDQITYAFVPQVFLHAYEYAWNHPEEKTFLVIEELNRGNCAQIFGDVFQLLDRRVDDYPGFSKYKINADTDIAKHLKKHITNKDGSYENKIKEIYGLDEFDFSVMAIPDNLYILATMNTSDQSLFPIDSAFKRRWEWEYVDVNYSDAAQFCLKIDDGHIYYWSQLLFGLNSYIKSKTHNTNKILGNRFVQAGADKTISAKSFRDKVLFFLFNDVFKDDDDFKIAFFGENAEDKFFEDLCVSNDTELTIKFIENICGAKNIVPAETPAEDTTETATK